MLFKIYFFLYVYTNPYTSSELADEPLIYHIVLIISYFLENRTSYMIVILFINKLTECPLKRKKPQRRIEENHQKRMPKRIPNKGRNL